MNISDPVADMLTRIRNANTIKSASVLIPFSTLKKAIADVLKESGYIKDYKLIGEKKKSNIKVYLKYTINNESVISDIKRISKPGRRVYRGMDKLDKVLDGLGISIVSTPKGIMTDHDCRKLKMGGEVLCQVW